ncbi:MAG: oligosaccharide flippase family protein [Pirellulales bacterium]|nr:oligosaccharide flippase family protein [Pirellulales bacterium]
MADGVTENRSLKPDTLAASVAILLVANMVQRSIGFGRGILYCRWLSPEELGTWEMAYSFLLLAAPIIVLGLPGSFGRYLERFRLRGQLRTFLTRATVWTATLATVGMACIVWNASFFSQLVFGRPDATSLVLLVACSLMTVILHHYLEAVFSALRKFSIVSTMHFIQSISFAAISLTLLWVWKFSAASVVVGYGAACLLSVSVTLAWKGPAVLEAAEPDDGVSHREFWPPLLRFAFWVWVTNLCCHLFGVVDRYMLLHVSGLKSAAALTLVGHYHASRIVPVLFLSVATLLAGAVTPYLSHDWEVGDRENVSLRLNGVLKVTAFALLAGGVAVLWISPLIFHVAFGGRYDQGLAVLPWTLTYCAWYSLLLVAQNFLWCAEKTRLAVVPLVAGLMVNVPMDLALIPTWGLWGAVVGTTCATGVALAVLYWINRQADMRLDRGMLLLTIAPAALCLGPVGATTMLLIVAWLMPFSHTLVTQAERDIVARLLDQLRTRWRSYWLSPTEPAEQAHAIE